MSEKVIGYILLALGILTILFSGFSVYFVFTKRCQPIQFFNLGNLQVQLPQDKKAPAQAIPASIPLRDLMPAGVIDEPLNTMAHLVLMMFISGVGFKLASLGAMLVRPIKVKLKESSPAPKK